MLDEYHRGLRIPGTPIKMFRLRVLLFRAAEEPFTPEELADGEQFFSRSRCPALHVCERRVLDECAEPADCVSAQHVSQPDAVHSIARAARASGAWAAAAVNVR
jgi:hypothetical protein